MTREKLIPGLESCSASAGRGGSAVTTASTSVGIESNLVQIEVRCTPGPSSLPIVGLTEAAAREARVRVASALARIGVRLGEWATTITLTPASLPKSGAALDLAIAIGVLAAIGRLSPERAHAALLLGELSLDGSVRAVRGVLPKLEGARTSGVREAIVPAGNAREAGLVKDIVVRVARDLEEVCAHLRGERELARAPAIQFVSVEGSDSGYDLSAVRGQPAARRAIEVAAAGAHGLLMVGPPGSGKTLLARMVPSILPPLALDEALEITAVHSVAGLLDTERGTVSSRPFRAPHHSVSEAGLIGGGEFPRPGEVSLAHHGVLFLDELAEFRQSTLKALPQPLEQGRVSVVARRGTRAWFPAKPLLVAATTPCPCGYFDHPTRSCRCAPERRQRYLSRLGGALIDRFDVHVLVASVERDALISSGPGESSAAVRARVVLARTAQEERHTDGRVASPTNATLGPAEIERVAPLDSGAEELLEAAVRQGLTREASLSVRRVARTIADLDRSSNVGMAHVAEALQFAPTLLRASEVACAL